jgi:hypothetical protein
MEKSELENLSDRILSLILQRLYKNFEGEENLDYEDCIEPYSCDIEQKVLDSVSMIQHDVSDIDVDFLVTLYNLNYENINKKNTPLIRPKFSKYVINVDVRVEQVIDKTYEHEIGSYNSYNVIHILSQRQECSSLSYWDGSQIYEDVIKEEVDEENWDYSSLKKIN